MFFFCKSNKITVDAFTFMPHAQELFPIQRSIKNIPDWWKKMPTEIHPTKHDKFVAPLPTIKKCYAIQKYYKNSFTLPSWSDIIVNTQDNGKFVYQFAITNVEKTVYGYGIGSDDIHGAIPEEIVDEYIHLKIISPWLIREKTGINFSFSEPKWDRFFLNDLKIMPGLVTYDLLHITHINCFAKKENKSIMVKAGEPLVNLIPLTEKKVELKTHLVDYKEFERINSGYNHISFSNSFLNFKKLKKNKCPIS